MPLHQMEIAFHYSKRAGNIFLECIYTCHYFLKQKLSEFLHFFCIILYLIKLQICKHAAIYFWRIIAGSTSAIMK